MEVRTWSYTNAFGEEQEAMEFRINNGDGSNQYVEVHALLNAFAESTLNFLKVEEVIKSVPKSDVAPVVHGEWIMLNPSLAKCSACGGYESTNGKDLTMKGIIFKEMKRYCPHCGADMRGEKDV